MQYRSPCATAARAMPSTAHSVKRSTTFEALALGYKDCLFKVAFCLTRDHADAEDLVQETYLRAYAYFDGFVIGTSFKAWSLTILRSIAINQGRKSKREGLAVELQSIGYRLACAPPQRATFAWKDLEAALRRLPREYRATFVLFALEGQSYEQISRNLDCPIGTVMSRLHRARRRLKADLQI